MEVNVINLSSHPIYSTCISAGLPFCPTSHCKDFNMFCKRFFMTSILNWSGLVKLGVAMDWKLLADLGQTFWFTSKITTTNYRLDHILWFTSLCTVYVIELRVPWDDVLCKACDCKNLKNEFSADAKQHGRRAKGFLSGSCLQRFCRHINYQAA